MADGGTAAQGGWGESSQPPWWQDPTRLTNEAVTLAKEDLRRDLATQRELLAERIARLEEIIHDLDQRFSSEIGRRVDSSYALLNQRDDSIQSELKTLTAFSSDSGDVHDALRLRLQADIAVAIRSLKDLHEERFSAIGQQFTERDIRADQDKRASKDALDAALLAQKEAVAQQNDANTTAATKSETSFTKQIDQIGTLIATLEKSLTDRITELKERIDRGEGSTAGATGQRTEQRLNIGAVVASIGAAVGIVAIIVTIIIATGH